MENRDKYNPSRHLMERRFFFFFLSNGKEVLVALKNNAAKLRSGPVG